MTFSYLVQYNRNVVFKKKCARRFWRISFSLFPSIQPILPTDKFLPKHKPRFLVKMPQPYHLQASFL